MNTAISRALPRTLIAAGLALFGTIASFTVTTAPAHAAAARVYTASLATALEAPRREIINGVQWKCEGDSCAAPVDGSRPANSCARLVRKIGPVTRFAGPNGELSAEDLQRCNAAA